jgi:hypothetical protein
MKTTIIALLLFISPTNLVFGQSSLGQYKSHPKSEIDVEIELVSEDALSVSPKNPLIIKTPNKSEVFKIYAFTKIWDNGKYKVFLGLSDDPFKPNLVTMTSAQTEIDQIQLLGNYGENRDNYSIKEEAKILSDKEIILTATITRWTLDDQGEKLKGSEKIELKTTKYKINDKGKFEKL